MTHILRVFWRWARGDWCAVYFDPVDAPLWVIRRKQSQQAVSGFYVDRELALAECRRRNWR
jgi:hypothetical protein